LSNVISSGSITPITEEEKKLMKIFKDLAEDKNSIGQGMEDFNTALDSDTLGQAFNNMKELSSIKFPLEAFFSQLIGQINADTARQSAETLAALLRLIQSDAVQIGIEAVIAVVTWILETITLITNWLTTLSEIGEAGVAEREGEVGEIIDPQRRPWWWPPFVPWVPAGGEDDNSFIPPGDGTN